MPGKHSSRKRSCNRNTARFCGDIIADVNQHPNAYRQVNPGYRLSYSLTFDVALPELNALYTLTGSQYVYCVAQLNRTEILSTKPLRRLDMFTSTRSDPDVYTKWQELCSTFIPRRPLAPRRQEIVPSIIRMNFDQLTWHCRYNMSWQDATTLMSDQGTLQLQTLHELASENLVHHKHLFFSSATASGILTSFLLFIYDHIRDDSSTFDFLSFLYEEKFISGPFVVLILIFVSMLFRNFNSLLRARELSSCIHVKLSLQNLLDQS